jgi:conjugative transfer pilus assembly protein TraH
MITKKVIAWAMAAAFLSQAANAGDNGMQQLFDDMGAFGNVTGPGAYRAQGMNVVTGGNLFMRTPQRNYNPGSVTLPSLKMGCGGIDLYAGSFSFISKSELVSMMKNIGSSAVSYAFKLALDSISPQINKTLTELQQTAQDLNAMNINSCEAGEAVARGVGGDWQRSAQYFAKVTAPVTGLFTDHSEAREAVQGDNAKVNAAISAVTDPATKEQVQPGNIAWRALSRLAGLDVDDRKILMALSGTTIISPDQAADQPPLYKEPKAITIQQFIRGNENGKLPVYGCVDSTTPEGCLVLSDDELAVTPFAQKVETKLLAIANKFKNNIALTPDEISFINITGLPVYKALAVSTAAPNVGLDTIWIGKYADLIAAEYAYQYIVQATHQIKQAYSQASSGAPAMAIEDMKTMSANVDRLRTDAREEVRLAYSKVESVNKIAEEVIYMERNLMASLPANLAGNLRFASAGK